MLFVLGGNGTHAGANAIHDEVLSLFLLLFENISFCISSVLPKLVTRVPGVNAF